LIVILRRSAALSQAEPGIGVDIINFKPIDSRHPWRSPFGPPPAFALAVLPTQSDSGLRPAPE